MFNGRQCKVSNRGAIVNCVFLNISESDVHFGHHPCINDKEKHLKYRNANFTEALIERNYVVHHKEVIIFLFYLSFLNKTGFAFFISRFC